MKLTKLHIFLILLLALVLCYTLGMCSNQELEGFANRSEDTKQYKSYSEYNTQKNDDTIRNINTKDNKPSNYKNPFYNKAKYDPNDIHYDITEMNNGDINDRSYMNTSKTKYSRYDRGNYDDENIDRISVFDSVAKGQMNGAMYNIKTSTIKENDNEGISRSQIPKGQENLYILKSEIVPPICPACPAVNCNKCSGSDAKKCPPCPPCARCPEPSFECKKVPNYNSTNLMNQLPIPWASKL